LKKTKDWVIIFYDKGMSHGQITVVTEIYGPLKGKRVIRGRENDCKKFYNSKSVQTTGWKMD